MRYYRIETGDSQSLIAADESAAYDLTATEAAPTSFFELASAASLTDGTVDDVARGLVEEAPTVELEERGRCGLGRRQVVGCRFVRCNERLRVPCPDTVVTHSLPWRVLE